MRDETMTTSEDTLRRLTIADPAYCRAVMASELDDPTHPLDARSVALVRLGASIAAGSVGPMWQQRVGDALAAGLSFDEIVESLIALAPTVGIERVVAVAPDLSRALGYDIDAALEQLDDAPAPPAAGSPGSRTVGAEAHHPI
jgi:alkylhydroperoxidase/carboxymuconolactone decarboxylase family protein YurZ